MGEPRETGPAPQSAHRQQNSVLYQGHAWATRVLLGVIGIFFALETLLGGSEVGRC